MSSIIYIDLKAFDYNLAEIFSNVKCHEVCAVVKANAYSHGVNEVVKHLYSIGVRWFAVTNIDEANVVKKLGLSEVNILALACDIGCIEFIDYSDEIILTVHTIEVLKDLAALSNDKKIRCHLEIDTGMTRTGINFSEIKTVVNIIKRYPNLLVEGLFSHFVAADDVNSEINVSQSNLFETVLLEFASSGIFFKHVHIANSAGTLHKHKNLPTNIVRPGLALYGIKPCDTIIKFRPVMSWTTKIIQLRQIYKGQGVSYNHTWKALRDSIIATLPVGYADGYPRLASNKGYVIIKNKYLPIVGNICMDFMMIDVTDCIGVNLLEDAILIGKSDDFEVSCSDLAKWSDTIAYEILCSVGKRASIQYSDGKK